MPIPTLNSSHKTRFSVDHGRTASSSLRETYAAQDDITSDVSSLTQPSRGSNVKRRSLLPQPGQSKFTSRVAESPQLDESSEEQVSIRSRPRSMYQPKPTIPAPAEGDGVAPSRMAPPSRVIAKPSTSTTGVSRSQSLRKPMSSTQTAQTSGAAAHARTKSSGSAIVHHSRLPSQSSMAAPSIVPASQAPTATRTSARLAGLSRTASSRSKPETEKTVPAPRPAQRTDPQFDAQPRRKEVPKATIAPPRPAFTTLQQHFTPRKVGKAPTSTFLQPLAAPSSDTLRPELLSIQSELLQLHILHSVAAPVEQQWQQSAKQNLSKTFDEVANLYAIMLQYERTGQEQKNLQALFEWSDGRQASLVEYIQLLSGPLHDLPSLVGPEGRYDRLVAAFEQWMIPRIGHGVARTITSTQTLNEQWKAEAAAMTRKMIAYARDLSQLHQPGKGSSIASILEACKSLVEGMLEELRTLRAIVESVEAEEKLLVEDSLQNVAQEFGAKLIDPGTSKAAWQM